MVRKREPVSVIGPDWFLVEWMRSTKTSQAALSRLTGWSKATCNDIVHRRTSYYRQILNEAASALHVQPFELLMPPEDAMALRRMRDDALRIASDRPHIWGDNSDVTKLRDGTTG